MFILFRKIGLGLNKLHKNIFDTIFMSLVYWWIIENSPFEMISHQNNVIERYWPKIDKRIFFFPQRNSSMLWILILGLAFHNQFNACQTFLKSRTVGSCLKIFPVWERIRIRPVIAEIRLNSSVRRIVCFTKFYLFKHRSRTGRSPFILGNSIGVKSYCLLNLDRQGLPLHRSSTEWRTVTMVAGLCTNLRSVQDESKIYNDWAYVKEHDLVMGVEANW